jgi:ribosomal protein S6--L-glutamate ligase
MRIAIVSGGDGWHVRDLQRAAAPLGNETRLIDFRRVHAGIAATADAFADSATVLVRTMPPGSLEQVVFRMDVLHRLQARGVPVLNPPLALETCVDKFLAGARLEAADLRVPPTIVCQHADAAMEAFLILGGDVVVKPLFGSEGRGMVRVSDRELAWRTFQTLERIQSVIYLQKFIDHPGWDLRAFVLGDRVIAAMCRHCHDGWRTNIAQGGLGETVRLKTAEEQLALRAAHVVGASVAGVDLLLGPAGEWYVLEVNAVPGWRALARVTGVDVAAEVIRYLTDEFHSR